MKKGILFDLDGTLWDSSNAVADSWNERLAKLSDAPGRITVERMRSCMGLPMDALAYACFPQVDKARALELMRLCTEYENEYIAAHGGSLFDGLEETFARLHGEYFLAIVSNCQMGYIEAFLEHYGFEKYIDDTENYGRTLRSKGENIRLLMERNQLDRAVYVGDIMGDYEAAAQAGIPFIHAAYGFGEAPEQVPRIMDIRELSDCVAQILA